MARIRCFLLEETGRVAINLRRYHSTDLAGQDICLDVNSGGYHNASIHIGDEPAEYNEQGYIINGIKSVPAHDDPRWPTSCICGYVFQEKDEWQRFTQRLYRRVDTGEEMILRNAPAGAMWYAEWLDKMYTPQGEHVLMVKTPGGDWVIDGRASNCGMPDDEKQERHHCWVRHGTPPDITVSKQGGPTCSAGAGSILCGSYHGFLREGYLEDA